MPSYMVIAVSDEGYEGYHYVRANSVSEALDKSKSRWPEQEFEECFDADDLRRIAGELECLDPDDPPSPRKCECGAEVSSDDPYFAAPCGAMCEECMDEHAVGCAVCRKEFDLEADEKDDSEIESAG